MGASAKRQIWDYAVTVEAIIDRRPDAVWPYFFGEKKQAWAKGKYRSIAGEAGKVGELYVTENPTHGVYLYFEAIKVDPERELVLKISYGESQDAERKLLGYDLVTFRESRGTTTVTLQQVCAFPIEKKLDLGLETAKQQEMLSSLFAALKEAVERNHQ